MPTQRGGVYRFDCNPRAVVREGVVGPQHRGQHFHGPPHQRCLFRAIWQTKPLYALRRAAITVLALSATSNHARLLQIHAPEKMLKRSADRRVGRCYHLGSAARGIAREERGGWLCATIRGYSDSGQNLNWVWVLCVWFCGL